jgi:prepilin-type N-terminal cleavage/methylation domain-containing protein
MLIRKLRETGRKAQKGFTLIELMIVVAIIAILAAVAIPNFLRAKYRANFTACKEQLVNIRSGIEAELTEQGDLSLVTKSDDVCHHVLAGYTKQADCNAKGEVLKRVKGVCIPASVEPLTKLTDYTYEIKGVSNEKTACTICVTESTVSPGEYSQCPGACVH